MSMRSEVLRKVMHIASSLLLLIPLTPLYRDLFSKEQPSLDPTLLTYSILLFIFSLINSIQIRLPNIEDIVVSISREHRERFLEYINEKFSNSPLSEFVKGIERIINRFESQLMIFIDTIKRDYEKRYGYVSITFALLSVFLSYVLWWGYNQTGVYIGILALAIVDGLTSLVSVVDRKSRRIFKHTLLAYVVASSVFSLLIYSITLKPLLSIVVSIATVVIEMLSPEDNLTLPLLSTSLFCILNNYL